MQGMHSICNTLLSDFDSFQAGEQSQYRLSQEQIDWLLETDESSILELIDGLLQRSAPEPDTTTQRFLSELLGALAGSPRLGRYQSPMDPLSDLLLERIVLLYKHLGPASSARHELLRMLTKERSGKSLAKLAEVLADDPPQELSQVALVLAPLFQNKDYDTAALFPKLLEALAHQSIAAAILDLANFITRQQLSDVHPAADHCQALTQLLGELLQRLGCLEEQPDESGSSAHQLSEKIAESVALAVSLCDALALIGDKGAIGKLNQALTLGHRRLRTEAAAALVRLGEKSAIETLVEMAAEPIARLRTLIYCQELNLIDRIDEKYQTPVAQAEADLALWLSDPTQMGMAPTEIELVDRRYQFWPSYDEPLDCYLFRYTYCLNSASYSNIGIAGPLTYACTADLGDLPPDDIYAAFAGWQAEHPEIVEIDCDSAGEAQQGEIERLRHRIQEEDYEQIEPIILGLFFGEKALVATAMRNDTAGLTVVDAASIYWYPRDKSVRPLGPREVYFIYKGHSKEISLLSFSRI